MTVRETAGDTDSFLCHCPWLVLEEAIIGRGSCGAKKAPDNAAAVSRGADALLDTAPADSNYRLTFGSMCTYSPKAWFAFVCTVAVIYCANSQNYYRAKFECGPYGFICENGRRLRLCEDDRLYGPAFLCPENTFCNEATNDVCESTVNYIEPTISKAIRCSRNERIADPTVPGCKGYILCIPNKNRFQGIKFKCAGNTIFNGVSRTCSAPDRYKCPLGNNTKVTDFFKEEVRRVGATVSRNDNVEVSNDIPYRPRPIDCKNYKFSVRQEGSPVGRVAYFCPPRPVSGDALIRCTVFSNQFCITLTKEEEDQFVVSTGFAHRKPRLNNLLT